MNERSERKKLPGGFGAGTGLGGLCFIVKFNGACMRPPLPRPITQNQCMQVKFVDDATQIASVDLKKSLIQDTVLRQRPLIFHEQTEMILSPEENILNTELQKFHDLAVSNKLVINRKKCYVMKFSWSRKFDFPEEMIICGSEILEVKTKHRILGIIVQDDLRWQSQ